MNPPSITQIALAWCVLGVILLVATFRSENIRPRTARLMLYLAGPIGWLTDWTISFLLWLLNRKPQPKGHRPAAA